MADSKLSVLGYGNTPDYFYGSEGGVSKRYSGSSIINVKDFGANSTGTVECSANIQAAWNYASTIALVSGRAAGAILFFPAGAYQCGTRLIDPCGYPVAFRGAGNSNGNSASAIFGNVAGYLVDSPDPLPNFTRANSTAYIGGISVHWESGTASSCTSSGTTLTVGGTITGVFTPGRGLISADGRLYRRYIVSQLSGTAGGAGTYQMDAAGSSDITTPTSATCVMVTSCLRSGTSASTIPTTVGKVVGNTITDGTVTWVVQNLYPKISYALVGIEDMGISNTSTTTDDGGLRIDALAAGFFKNVRVGGCTAIHCSGNQFGSVWQSIIANTSFSDVGRAGTYGMIMGQNSLYDCAVNGFGVGVATYGSNFAMYGGHIETNTTGILLGMDPTGASNIAHGSTIKGVSFERNAVSINMQNVAGFEISNNNLTGTIGPDGTTPIVTGLTAGTISGGIIQGNTAGGQFSNAGYDFSVATAQGVGVMFNNASVSGTGVKWKMPSATMRGEFTFIGNDNFTTPFELAFADLPGQPGNHLATPMTGMTYDISDCSTSTFLATAAAGGTGATAHRKVRYNATAAVWQVIG